MASILCINRASLRNFSEPQCYKTILITISLLVGGILAALGAANCFGCPGSVGFIASIALGSTFVLVSMALGGVGIIKKILRSRIIADVQIDNFSSSEEANKYLGKRDELWLKCRSGQLPESLLSVHTVLMRDKQDQGKGFLWEVELNNQKAYLYGSHHARLFSSNDPFQYVFDGKAYTDGASLDLAYDSWLKTVHEKAKCCLPKQVFEAFLQAEGEIYFEMNDADRRVYQREYASQIKAFQKEIGFGKHIATSWQPFGSEWLLSNSAKYRYHFGHSLETSQEVVQAIALLSKALDDEKEYGTIKEEIALQLTDAWIYGDWEQFEKILLKQPKAIKEALNGKNNRRNENFALKISQLLSQNKATAPFIVIGAAHFSGGNGILQLLTNKGAKIKFISY